MTVSHEDHGVLSHVKDNYVKWTRVLIQSHSLLNIVIYTYQLNCRAAK